MNMSNMMKVGGNTYPVKEILKTQCRARWSGAERCWMVPSDKHELAMEIVNGGNRVKAVVPGIPASVDSAIVWSEEQAAIVEWFRTGLVAGKPVKNLVVRARAGTGKTFTIIGGASAAPEAEILYAVFGAKNRDEASEKINDSRITVLSLHQCGYRFGIKRYWPKSRPDDDVEWDRIRTAIGGEAPAEVLGELYRLVAFSKNTFIGLPQLDEVVSLANDQLIECEAFESNEAGGWTVDRLSEVALEVLALSMIPDSLNRISFNDMVWLPIAMNWISPRFSFIIVDECQDMNAPQLEIAIRLCSGRMAVVGDDRQAIFAFRGAVQDGIDRMKKRLDAGELGLTATRRCGIEIVNEAQKFVPDIKSAPGAHNAVIDEMDLDSAVKAARRGDSFLSRVNAPLMPLCLSFIRQGIAARIEGRDVGAQLLSTINKLKARSIPEVIRKAEAWGARMIKRANGKESKIILVQDTVSTIIALVEGLSSVNEISARVEAIFADTKKDSNAAVVLSSTHKAKGLEWNRVFVLGNTFKFNGPQENNLKYVAITRAKRHLTYVESTLTPTI